MTIYNGCTNEAIALMVAVTDMFSPSLKAHLLPP